MAITVGEVNAVLTAKDDMSTALKQAQQNVKDLETTFASLGPMSQASMQSAEQALAEARAEVDKIQASMNAAGVSATALSTATKDAGESASQMGGAVEKSSATMDQMDRIATRLIERMAIMFALRGVEQFTLGLFTAASNTANLAAEFDLSTEKVQEFDYAAKQTGISLGTITGAADTLGKKLASGSDSVDVALKQLGLDTAQFFDSNPGERFDQVSSAIANMGDKTLRTGAELALFGTDKIDPVILKLQALEDAAHRVGVVLDEEDVKALDAAKKSLETVTTAIEVQASKWLVAAQNAVAYLATLDLIATHPKSPTDAGMVSDANANPNLDPMLTLPGRPAAPRLPTSSTSLGLLDPANKQQLEAIHGIEKELTDDAHIRMDAEKALAAFEAIANKDRLKQLSDEYTANAKIEDAINKANNVAEESARANVLGRFGQKINPNTGEPMRPGEEDPAYQLQQTLDRLKNAQSSQFGPDRDRSTAFQQQDAIDKYLQSQYEEAVAVDKATNALSNQAAAVAAVNKAHIALTPSLASVAQGFEGISLQIAASAEQMQQYYAALALKPNVGGSAQPVRSGAGFQNLAQDALTNQNILNGNGGLNVTVQGNVYTMDPSGKAAFAQLVNDAISPTLQAGRKLGSA